MPSLKIIFKNKHLKSFKAIWAMTCSLSGMEAVLQEYAIKNISSLSTYLLVYSYDFALGGAGYTHLSRTPNPHSILKKLYSR